MPVFRQKAGGPANSIKYKPLIMLAIHPRDNAGPVRESTVSTLPNYIFRCPTCLLVPHLLPKWRTAHLLSATAPNRVNCCRCGKGYAGNAAPERTTGRGHKSVPSTTALNRGNRCRCGKGNAGNAAPERPTGRGHKSVPAATAPNRGNCCRCGKGYAGNAAPERPTGRGHKSVPAATAPNRGNCCRCGKEGGTEGASLTI